MNRLSWTARRCPGFDQSGSITHLILDRVAQQFRSGDDAGRDKGEQQRVLDRRNAALVVPEPREKLFKSVHELLPVSLVVMPAQLPAGKYSDTESISVQG